MSYRAAQRLDLSGGVVECGDAIPDGYPSSEIFALIRIGRAYSDEPMTDRRLEIFSRKARAYAVRRIMTAAQDTLKAADKVSRRFPKKKVTQKPLPAAVSSKKRKNK